METVAVPQLWLPIVLSAAWVLVISSVFHTVLQLHKGDCQLLPGEDAILDALRAQGVPPGNYMFPGCSSMKEMCSEEMIAKQNRGPVGYMAVLPSRPFNIGKSLGQWFIYALIVSFFVAYICSFNRAAGADFRSVFRLAGTVAVVAYALSDIPASIWKAQPWRITAKFMFEGVVYGLGTGAVFAWLWPAGA